MREPAHPRSALAQARLDHVDLVGDPPSPPPGEVFGASCGRFTGLYEGDRLRRLPEFPTRAGGRTVPAVVRPIDADDWCAIVDLEADAYSGTGHSETRTALESRARSSPTTSFVLDVGESVRGYLIALPYPPFRFPELDRVEEAVFRSSNLHLHDILVAKEIRGRGWARRLLRHLTDTARSTGYEQISLVSVGGTTGFWSAHGYRAHPEVSLSRTYGPDAVYMSRVITGEG